MLFNSIPFLVFAALFLPAYCATRGRVRLWVCVLGSYLFYGWWDWRYLGIILFNSAVNFAIGFARTLGYDFPANFNLPYFLTESTQRAPDVHRRGGSASQRWVSQFLSVACTAGIR